MRLFQFPMQTFKDAERVIRLLRRDRGPNFTGLHEFTTYASVFEPEHWTEAPNHVKALVGHLANSLMYGLPDRPSGSRDGEVYAEADFTIRRLPPTYPKIEYARRAKYSGWGEQQHAKVQQYLHNNDPYILATEVPVWGDTWNGVADDLTLAPSWVVDVGDFKPDLPATVKKQTPHPETGVVPIKTKGMLKIVSQLTRYYAGFIDLCNSTPAWFRAIAYDHEAAFEIIRNPLTT